MLPFLRRFWFLLALVAVIAAGILLSSALGPLSELRTVRYGIVFCVLFVMALPLPAADVWKSLQRPAAPALAILINLAVLPAAGWAMSHGMSATMVGGFFVACSTPCTLASAAVWTRRAGGNDTAALLVTILTNLACFITTPLILLMMTGERVDLPNLQLGPMMLKLGLLVLLPMALAQIVRQLPGAAGFAARQKTPLGVLAQVGVLSMIFLGSIRTGLVLAENSDQGGGLLLDWCVMAALVAVLHLGMLALGYQSAALFGMPREDRIAVGIAGSQKTLMVGLQVALDLQVSILPMVTYHVMQLLLDTLIADWLKARAPKSDQAEAPEPQPPSG